MKKANFTLFQLQRWMSKMGQSTLAVLFVLCCIGLQNADAQDITATIVHPHDGVTINDGQLDTTGTYKIEACEGENILYTDDNTGDGTLYYDNFAADFTGFAATGVNRDTFEICPQDDWHKVKVTFTDFDIAAGDVLRVFQGDIEAFDAAAVAAAANARAAVAGAANANDLVSLNSLQKTSDSLEVLYIAAQADSLAEADSVGITAMALVVAKADSATAAAALIVADSVAMATDSLATVAADSLTAVQLRVQTAKNNNESDSLITALTAQVVEAAELAESTTDAMIAAEMAAAMARTDSTTADSVLMVATTANGVAAPEAAAAKAEADRLRPQFNTAKGLYDTAKTAYDLAYAADLISPAANAAADAAADAIVLNRNRLSGSGVGQTGGWVEADCDPKSNASGCLTFVFDRNGDNRKGTGWEAWVTCEARVINIEQPLDISVKLTCDSSAYATGIVVKAPEVTACGTDLGIFSDSMIVTVFNQAQGICMVDTLSFSERTTIVDTFAIGIYTVKYVLLSDPSPLKTVTSRITVQAPNLVCNDDVRIPFGSACMVAITPDMILEQPCEAIEDTMSYSIKISIGGEQVAISTTENPYPILTRDAIEEALGVNGICGGTATVEITRTYTSLNRTTGKNICNNGAQSQTCSTDLFFEDKSDPIFTSAVMGTDTLIACDTTGIFKLLNIPTAIDNCDSVAVTYEIKGVPDFSVNPCFEENILEGEITIVYTATDACGNEAEAIRNIVLIRPSTAQIVDAGRDTLECNSDAVSELMPRLAIGRFVNDAFEPADTIDLSTTEYICGYILTSTPVTLPAPGCGKKVYKYWSVLDWCDPSIGPSAVDTQFILYTDRVAPVFADVESTEDNPQIIELGPFVCETIEIPNAPTADDACAGDVTDNRRIITRERLVDTVWTTYTEDAYVCDTFRIVYRVFDDCHTQPLEDTTTTYFIVQDVTKPSAICTDELTVSIGSGSVRIFPQDLDAGSYDACDSLIYRIRSVEAGDATWGPHVDLTCNNKGTIEVELLVIGDKTRDSVTCWGHITIEDKINPICGQLPNDTLLCNDPRIAHDPFGVTMTKEEFEANTELKAFYNTTFGDPSENDLCSDNCGINVYEQKIVVDRKDCGEIKITRSYRVGDWNTATRYSEWRSQTIVVEPVHDFKLTFPADQAISCSERESAVLVEAWDLDDILTTNDGCDIFALEVTEREFTSGDDFCKKIERTYEVINWCIYEAGATGQRVDHVAEGGAMVLVGRDTMFVNGDTILALNGRYVYTQTIKYSVDVAPTVTLGAVDQDITSSTNDPDQGYTASCGKLAEFSATAKNCLEGNITNITYTLKVDGVDVTADTENEGQGGSFTYDVVPGSDYAVEFWAFDDCGNSTGADSVYTFVDRVRPTPFVLHGIAVEMGQTTTVEIWASDLNRGSFDNCYEEERLEYRIRLGLPEDGPANDATAADVRAATSANITFDCDNFGDQIVSFYVIDGAGNWDVVETYVLVDDNFNVCGGGDPMAGRIAGKVTNAFGENVEAVSVSVNGGDNSMTTTSTGQFTFNLPLAGDYTITPEKNMNPLNGVSTFDLVLISKHILGLQSFDSPYKYIAADVNKSGSITAFDMVQLRQLILNVTSEFPNNTSWRFVDAKHEFTSANPAAENFDEFMSINDLAGAMLDINFIAAKIGDVNGTASANSLLGAEARNINGTLNLNVTDRLVEAGQTVTVDFTSADIATAQGYQFTMDFAGLELVELNEGVAKAANFNTNLANRGMLTTSWNGEATANDVLFSLTFTATTNGLLSELVSVNSDLTVAEAYNNAGELMNVALDFNTSATAAAFGLQQNTPNPFNGETVIGFNLPEAGLATLKVMDVQGKVLTSIERDGVKGYNQVTINARTLSATGVLYYQLESADNVATKKMIIID